MKRPTIKDVARQAGCSLSTVSLVVNKTGYVSKETRERVLKVVKDLGYHATRSARGLASKTSGNIGFVVRDDHFSQAEPFYTRVFLGAEFAAGQHGFYVLLSTVSQRFHEPEGFPRFLLERNVDGLIIAGRVPLPFVSSVARFNIPIVLVDFEAKRKRSSAVLIDNRSGAHAAIQHLIALGHQHIACVCGDINHPSLAERLEGYRDTLVENGIPVQDHLIDMSEPDTRIANGINAMTRLLKQRPRPTAVFAGNDAMAIGCIQVIQRAGLRIPEDISVVGFDDVELSALMHPPLTTVRVFKEELGRLAIETLVQIINEGSSTLITKHVRAELVVRGSTASASTPIISDVTA
jgi:LacI family transcriptional regulator